MRACTHKYGSSIKFRQSTNVFILNLYKIKIVGSIRCRHSPCRQTVAWVRSACGPCPFQIPPLLAERPAARAPRRVCAGRSWRLAAPPRRRHVRLLCATHQSWYVAALICTGPLDPIQIGGRGAHLTIRQDADLTCREPGPRCAVAAAAVLPQRPRWQAVSPPRGRSRNCNGATALTSRPLAGHGPFPPYPPLALRCMASLPPCAPAARGRRSRLASPRLPHPKHPPPVLTCRAPACLPLLFLGGVLPVVHCAVAVLPHPHLRVPICQL